MMLLKEYLTVVQFRDDILRGVRLFLIAFAAILVVVWASRILRTPSDVQGASQQELPPEPEASQPSADPTPETAAAANSTSEPHSEPHGLTVPPPPPVAGTHVRKASRPARAKAPAASAAAQVVSRERRAPAPSGREFESIEPGVLPSAPAEESGDASPASPKKGVGYKSLLEADPARAPIEPSLLGQQQPVEKPKVNRFRRAVGKIFHPGGKKETVPLTLQQPKP